jgi:pimeloyl-ACP methyl ester carboxylesterase
MTIKKPKHLPESDSLSSYSDTALPTPLTRRGFIARSVAALSVGPFVFPSLNQARTMTTDLDVVARAPDTRQAQKTSIRPFTYRAPQSELDDLRRRILAARLPEKEPVSDWSQGVKLATVQKLAHYWATQYDWRKVEAKLDALPQFITEIDGLDIHFAHVRSKHENALPIIITHGWPGSLIEQIKIIDPLVNPTAHGGKASDAFHVVVPNMPGYGFSGKPTTTGWGPDRIGRAWAVLMRRLGYTRYVAQGGDWGGLIVDVMATQGHPELIGIHTNFAGVVPPEIDKAAQVGAPAPAGLSAEEKITYDMIAFTYKNVQYAFYMASRPQTLYGIADSPIGLASWLLDHDPRSLEMIARSFDGVLEGLTRDDVLDNCTYFWLTNTGVSAGRLYRENTFNYFSPKGVNIPVAVSVFPDELYHAPRSWSEKAYPKLVHYNKLDTGGHFAAWEQPKLFVEELRVGLRSLRS